VAAAIFQRQLIRAIHSADPDFGRDRDRCADRERDGASLFCFAREVLQGRFADPFQTIDDANEVRGPQTNPLRSLSAVTVAVALT
jgi:hypothetical protein